MKMNNEKYFLVTSKSVDAPKYFTETAINSFMSETRYIKNSICYYGFAKSEKLAYEYISQFRKANKMLVSEVSKEYIDKLIDEVALEEIQSVHWGFDKNDEPIFMASTLNEVDIYSETLLPDGFEMSGEENSFVRIMALMKVFKKSKAAKKLKSALIEFFNEVQGTDAAREYGKKFFLYKLEIGGLR